MKFSEKDARAIRLAFLTAEDALDEMTEGFAALAISFRTATAPLLARRGGAVERATKSIDDPKGEMTSYRLG